MLLNTNYKNRDLTTYACDRCKAVMGNDDKVAIYIAKASNPPKKKWDLCINCYKALIRGVKKGV